MGDPLSRSALAALAVALVAVVAASVVCGGRTYRSTIFSYPVIVQLPPGVVAEEVGYRCTFDREVAQFIAGDARLRQPFEAVEGVRFDAAVRGHRNTSWCGLFENAGRETFIVVRVGAASGEVYAGLAELPPRTGPVTVVVASAT